MLITLLNTAIQDQSIQLSPPTSGGLEASRMIHDCALRLENMSHHDNCKGHEVSSGLSEVQESNIHLGQIRETIPLVQLCGCAAIAVA